MYEYIENFHTVLHCMFAKKLYETSSICLAMLKLKHTLFRMRKREHTVICNKKFN